MGVIMYVSLSGEFPFDDEQDIFEQLNDFKYFFPSDPWDDISSTGKRFLGHRLSLHTEVL